MPSRRQFLAFPLVLLLGPRPGRAEPLVRSTPYHVDIGILWNLFTFTLDGRLDEQLDFAAGRYRVLITGEGPRIENRIESAGLIRDGRFTPTATSLFFRARGRENSTRISYDYDGGLVHYRHVSETFLLGRRRVAEDRLEIPARQPLDDIVTVVLNYSEGSVGRDGRVEHQTFVVRRARREREGFDEVQAGGYRAEIVPLRYTVTRDGETGRALCLLDFSGFSAWASPDKPARISFGPNRRLEAIDIFLSLGSSIRIKLEARAS